MEGNSIMKKLLLGVAFLLVLAGCSPKTTTEPTATPEDVASYEGVWTGISWKGEAKGVTLDEATSKIVTELKVDENNIITEASIDFLNLKDDQWVARNDASAVVTVDYSIDPVAASVDGEAYEKGVSMFDVKTNDMMGFYSVGVDENGTVALLVVDAVARYRFETKIDADFDFTTTLNELKINEFWTPTVRESSGGLVKAQTLADFDGKSIYELNTFNHVIYDYGVFAGLKDDATLESFLKAAGVTFEEGKPVAMEVAYGFHSQGGWSGNYEAIENFLVGKNITEVTALADFSADRYASAINEDNFFGVDVPTGATKTIQDSYDSISGATVRISRENQSFQRALVDAGILTEEEVIKGRY